MSIFVSNRKVLADLAIIFLAWASFLSLLLLLQKYGLTAGFDVWPIGEDRVWVDILRRGEGGAAAGLFWHINDRNPLSPWWYIAFRAVILNFDAGLILIRYLVGLGLALTTYMLLLELAGRKSRFFALGVALVVALFMPNGYIDQVYWNFQGALVASLICVLLYVRFLKRGRCDYGLFGLSLVFWFFAIASYTVQCGAIAAIGYLSLTSSNVNPGERSIKYSSKLITMIVDIAPYAALFGIFLLIWQTTMVNPSAYTFVPNASKLVSSLGKGIWHNETLWWLNWAIHSPNWMIYAQCAVIAAILSFVVVLRSSWGSSVGSGYPIGARGLLDSFIVVACLAAPTVVVETVGAYWLPGWRWRMVYQLTTPIVYLGLSASVVRFTTGSVKARQVLWSGAVGIAAGFALFMSLGHNRVQVDTTRNEKLVRDAVAWAAAQDLAVGKTPPLQYLIKTDPQFWWPASDLLSDVYARTWFQRSDISFRIIPRYPGPEEHKAIWPIKFLANEDGVANARIPGISVGYEQLGVLAVADDRVRRLFQVAAAEFAGFQIEWRRRGPIILSEIKNNGCSYAWSADQDALLSGWDLAETDRYGAARWTVRRQASIWVPLDCTTPALIRISVAYSLSQQNYDHLRVEVNNSVVQLKRRIISNEQIYEGEIPADITKAIRPTIVKLIVPQLDVINSSGRRLGILVRRIEISPGHMLE